MKRICLRSPGTMEGMVSRKKDATPSKAVLHVGGNKRTLNAQGQSEASEQRFSTGVQQEFSKHE